MVVVEGGFYGYKDQPELINIFGQGSGESSSVSGILCK